MGQARQRGTYEERKSLAIKRDVFLLKQMAKVVGKIRKLPSNISLDKLSAYIKAANAKAKGKRK